MVVVVSPRHGRSGVATTWLYVYVSYSHVNATSLCHLPGVTSLMSCPGRHVEDVVLRCPFQHVRFSMSVFVCLLQHVRFSLSVSACSHRTAQISMLVFTRVLYSMIDPRARTSSDRLQILYFDIPFIFATGPPTRRCALLLMCAAHRAISARPPGGTGGKGVESDSKHLLVAFKFSTSTYHSFSQRAPRHGDASCC
jgi:hypothetical protein